MKPRILLVLVALLALLALWLGLRSGLPSAAGESEESPADVPAPAQPDRRPDALIPAQGSAQERAAPVPALAPAASPGSIQVRVERWPDGEPIEDAALEFLPGPADSGPENSGAGSVFTDSNGTARLTPPPAARALRASRRRFESLELDLEALATARGRMALRPDFGYAGRLVDAHGEGVANAALQVAIDRVGSPVVRGSGDERTLRIRADSSSWRLDDVTTHAEGWFFIDPPQHAGGAQRLRIAAVLERGTAAAVHRLSQTQRVLPDLVLGAGQTLALRFVDPGGGPLEGIEVRVGWPSLPLQSAFHQGTSDAAGRYSVVTPLAEVSLGLEVADYDLVSVPAGVDAAALPTHRGAAFAVTALEQVFVLGQRPRVYGVVRDGTSGRPLANARVDVQSSVTSGQGEDAMVSSHGWTEGVDERGRFVVAHKLSGDSAELRLNIECPGYRSLERTLEGLPVGSPEHFEPFLLEPAADLEAGLPIAGRLEPQSSRPTHGPAPFDIVAVARDPAAPDEVQFVGRTQPGDDGRFELFPRQAVPVAHELLVFASFDGCPIAQSGWLVGAQARRDVALPIDGALTLWIELAPGAAECVDGVRCELAAIAGSEGAARAWRMRGERALGRAVEGRGRATELRLAPGARLRLTPLARFGAPGDYGPSADAAATAGRVLLETYATGSVLVSALGYSHEVDQGAILALIPETQGPPVFHARFDSAAEASFQDVPLGSYAVALYRAGALEELDVIDQRWIRVVAGPQRVDLYPQ